jgi:exodeoxyribonuclease VII large subunit
MAHGIVEAMAEKTFSVSEYTDIVNTLVSPLSVQVEGEVSGLRITPQWVFFDLKDTKHTGVLRCGMHSSGYRRIGVALAEGMQVVVSGSGKLTSKSGNFGFWVRDITLTGEGALRRAYEMLYKQLESEGLFRQKRQLPLAVSRIALVTSLSGVVIEDFRKNLALRDIQVSVVHSSVEGVDAGRDIVRALSVAENIKPDVVVVIRGGGSLESLQAFNTEMVARALFAMSVPTVVGIGHDVDVPIASKVADVAVSTPTAVAHAINATWQVVADRHKTAWEHILRGQDAYITEAMRRTELAGVRVRARMEHMRTLGEQYEQQVAQWQEHVLRVITEQKQTVDRLSHMSMQGVMRAYSQTQQNIATAERMLVAHDPRAVLGRGYAIPKTKKGVVKSVRDVAVGEQLSLMVEDGTIDTVVR